MCSVVGRSSQGAPTSVAEHGSDPGFGYVNPTLHSDVLSGVQTESCLLVCLISIFSLLTRIDF